jgi:hypothetical protein
MPEAQCRVRQSRADQGGTVLAKLHSKLTYANVMATIAVFLALGGGVAWALANDSVKSKHIKDGQVKSQDLSNGVEPQGFTYSAATGDDVQEEILDTGGYRFTAACESVSGQPSVEFFIDFPEDGRLVGLSVNDPSDGLGVASTGSGVEVDDGTTFDGGALTAPAGETAALGASFTYTGSSEAAIFNLHALADDDDDQCRIAGVLTPGIIPPA